ncbi:DUF5064 domain-containing protein [Pseudomonas chlororaphis]|jgi:hypothetical protein|uniref:DUF5064 family protein n=1 Tax=Pseudomonas morbosilactucae TaxID=2938197 RepID=A0A9X1YYE7_9PSED|nr:DUF5064 family protein [Pseudomonas morbosilactucae]MCK9799901.1 DUF5064 family protein [Pseudomonas morbosilactucae]MCK9814260.1 DUF5064 family protein [Pseudomonas morbosilactucae]ROL72333.1 DUF5064 domain-containing protein [Pseudomonas chlororaphis]WEK08814.1 MAG: DUF5064 family protein [Pseudomonas sp.]
MATFEPGHLHIQRAPLQPGDFGYDIKIDYEVVHDPKEGSAMHFTMHGEIQEKPFKEEFTLPKDLAYNFASEAFHVAVKYGIPKNADLRSMHGHYDRMFEDIREQLHAKPGDPVKPEHLE